MSNPYHLHTLRGGVQAWNQWREENPGVLPDLCHGFGPLRKKDLRGINFRNTNLSMAILHEADLSDADLSGADLSGASLGTNLSGARLTGTKFISTGLGATNFTGSFMANTIFANCDLSRSIGLDSIHHLGTSSISMDVLFESEGKIPEIFLRGAGLPDTFIEFAASLAGKSIEFHTAFISHSARDEAFAKRLNDDLQSNGVRSWLWPADLIFDREVYFAGSPGLSLAKFVLPLSADSLSRGWFQRLLELSLDTGKKGGRVSLFPITLDDAVMDSSDEWAVEMRRSSRIGDFRDWKNPDSYQKAFDQLLRDLKSDRRRDRWQL